MFNKYTNLFLNHNFLSNYYSYNYPIYFFNLYITTSRHFSNRINLSSTNSKIKSYLLNLKNDSARKLLDKIIFKTSSFKLSKFNRLDNIVKYAKESYPDHIVLIRFDNCYYATGIDSILLVEYAGLSHVPLTPLVEVHLSQIQNTLNKMTDIGLSVAVYEQLVNSGMNCKFNSKSHYLSQIVTKYSPIYNFNNRNTLNKYNTTKLFIIPAISYDTTVKSIRLHECLTMIGALSLLNSVPSDVFMIQNNSPEILSLVKYVSTSIHCQTLEGKYDEDEFHIAAYHDIARRLNITDDFDCSKVTFENDDSCPLNHECASVLGLNSDFGLQNLVLPSDSPVYMINYIKSLLLKHPKSHISDIIRFINIQLKTIDIPFIQIKSMNVYTSNKKFINISNDVNFYKNVYHNLTSFKHYYENMPNELVESILKIVDYELNIHSRLDAIISDVSMCIEIIKSVIKVDDFDNIIPTTGIESVDNLFNNMESFRTKCHSFLYNVDQTKVDNAAVNLLDSILKHYVGYHIPLNTCEINERRDYISNYLNDIKGDYTHVYRSIKENSNYIYIDKLNEYIDHTNLFTIESPKDCHTSVFYVNPNVTQCLINYKHICSIADINVNRIITGLSSSLTPYLQSFEIVSQFLIILQTLSYHVRWSLSRGWCIPNLKSNSFNINGLHYIFSNDSIPFNIDLTGLTIITGEHNTGKSTLLLSILKSLLLTNIGLYSPISSSSSVPMIKRYFYNSGIGNNIPFHCNVKKLKYIIDHVTEDSIVLLDNPGIGTNTTTTIKILLKMVDILIKNKCIAVISTHFQEYLMNTINLDGLRYSKIVNENGYKTILDGVFIQEKCDEYVDLLLKLPNNTYQHLSLDLKYQPDSNNINNHSFINDIPESIKHEVLIILKAISEIFTPPRTSNFIYLFPRSIPPPSYSHLPILYILLIPIKTVAKHRPKYAIYIGESGNIIHRLEKHRNKDCKGIDQYLIETYNEHSDEVTRFLNYKVGNQSNSVDIMDWEGSHSILMKCKSRKDAKLYERELINKIYKYPSKLLLISHRDGNFKDLPYLD